MTALLDDLLLMRYPGLKYILSLTGFSGAEELERPNQKDIADLMRSRVEALVREPDRCAKAVEDYVSVGAAVNQLERLVPAMRCCVGKSKLCWPHMTFHGEARSGQVSPDVRPARNQPLLGRRLGPYEMLSLLRRGGMGEVYRARDSRLDRIAALKLLPSEVSTGLPWSWSRARHWVTALSEGAGDIGMQATEALEEAHSKGITHRDRGGESIGRWCRSILSHQPGATTWR